MKSKIMKTSKGFVFCCCCCFFINFIEKRIVKILVFGN